MLWNTKYSLLLIFRTKRNLFRCSDFLGAQSHICGTKCRFHNPVICLCFICSWNSYKLQNAQAQKWTSTEIFQFMKTKCVWTFVEVSIKLKKKIIISTESCRTLIVSQYCSTESWIFKQLQFSAICFIFKFKKSVNAFVYTMWMHSNVSLWTKCIMVSSSRMYLFWSTKTRLWKLVQLESAYALVNLHIHVPWWICIYICLGSNWKKRFLLTHVFSCLHPLRQSSQKSALLSAADKTL